MKKYISLLLSIVMLASALPTVAVNAARGYSYQYIECETAATGEGFVASAEAPGSGGAALFLNERKDALREASITFNLSNAGEYDIYVLGSPSSSDWASQRMWKLDDGEYSMKYTAKSNVYMTSSFGLAASVGWEYLDTVNMDKGAHTLQFKCEKVASSTKFLLTVLDAVAVVPKEWNWVPSGSDTRPFDKNELKFYYASGEVSGTQFLPEEEIKVSAKYRIGDRTTASPNIYAELAYNGETVYRESKQPTQPLKSWAEGVEYSENYTLKIPFTVPEGEYEIRTGIEGGIMADGSKDAIISKVKIGKSEIKDVVPYTAKISNVTIPSVIEKGKPVQISADVELSVNSEKIKPYLMIKKDGLLYEVLEGGEVLNNGTVTFTGTLESDPPAGEYDAEVGIHYYNSEESKAKKVSVSGTDSIRCAYHKPMSFGNYYSKKTGHETFWYITQEMAAKFSGEIYMPFGGMICPMFLYGFKTTNPEANKNNFLKDVSDLETIRASGVNDLYINTPYLTNRPAWAIKYFLDYLDETGWYYGLQLNKPDMKDAEAYWPHATESSKRFEVKNVTQTGPVTLTSKLSPWNTGFKDAVSAVYIVINDETGALVDSGNCELTTDYAGNITFSADVQKIGNGNNTVYFTPRLFGGTGMAVNYWTDPEGDFARMDEAAKKLIVGDNLRNSIDINWNEQGFYNANESARFADDSFNAIFKNWIKEKYQNISALNEAWKAEPAISSFDVAVRLIPVYTTQNDENNNSYTYYVDMETGDGYKMNTKQGVSWTDYLDARDDGYLDYANKLSDVVKKHLDVPVIYKHSSVARRYWINKELVGGFDGIGSETYGNVKTVMGKTATSLSMPYQAARTQWFVITETNTLENMQQKYDSGKWAYETEEDMTARVKGFIDIGAKGVYDFLLFNRYDLGGIVGKAYGWIDSPRQIPWGGNINTMLEENKEEYASKQFHEEVYWMLPMPKNWWWEPNERSAVQLEDDSAPVQRGYSEKGAYIIGTDDVNVDTKLLLINIQDGPYSKMFGQQVSDLIAKKPVDKKIAVMGHRNDIGNIPEADKYYTNEKVKLSDTQTVQILKPTSTSVVLRSTPDGKPWALKDGNLYIIATNDFVTTESEVTTVHYIDELGVTDFSDLQITGDAVHADGPVTGFADMRGHWAEAEVNAVADAGIIAGVGNNMFNPDGKITIAEFASLITRVMGWKNSETKIPEISDDKWYKASFEAAADNGILTDEMKSAPERVAIREEMAVMVARALKLSGEGYDITVYNDSDKINAKDEVAAVSGAKLFFGTETGAFNSAGNATRAQAAAIIKRILDRK